LNKTEKEEMVGALSNIFNSAQVGFLADYRGLTVEQVTELRRKLHDSASGMKVLKNRLAKIAIKDTPFEGLLDQLTDTRAFIYGDEPVGPAKVVTEFSKDVEKFSLLQGILVSDTGASVLDVAQVKALGNLPSRDVLIAQLLSVMNAPIGKFVRTINEVPAKFVRTLAAVAASKGE